MKIIGNILRLVYSKFDYIFVTIEETQKFEAVTTEQLQERLKAYEDKQKENHGIEKQLRNMEVNPQKKRKKVPTTEDNMSEV